MTGALVAPMLRTARLLWGSGTAVLCLAALVCSLVGLQVKLLAAPLPSTLVTASSSVAGLALTSALLLLAPPPPPEQQAHSSRGGGSTARLKRSRSYAALAQPAGGDCAGNRRMLALLVLRGVLGAAAVGCFYASIELLPLNVATTIFFLNPAAAVLLEALISGAAPGRAALAGCGLTVAGVALIGSSRCPLAAGRWLAVGSCGLWGVRCAHGGSPAAAAAAGGAPLHHMGVALGIAAAVANAGSFCVVSRIGTSASPVVVTWWYHAIVAATSAAAGLGFGAWPLPSTHDAALLLGIAAANFGGQLLLNRGFALESASRGSALNTAQVPFSYLWGILVLHTPVGPCAALGSAVIVGGVLICVLCHEAPAAGAPHESTEAAEALDAQDSPSTVDMVARVSFESHAATPLLHKQSSSEAV